jgi:hypothetical protein
MRLEMDGPELPKGRFSVTQGLAQLSRTYW